MHLTNQFEVFEFYVSLNDFNYSSQSLLFAHFM
jgi:hypothetical protein